MNPCPSPTAIAQVTMGLFLGFFGLIILAMGLGCYAIWKHLRS